MIRNSHLKPGFLAAMLHRLSGIALAIFLPMHFIALGTALGGADSFQSFLGVTHNTFVRAAEWGLVTALGLHMALGVRVLAIEFLAMRERGAILVSVCVACSLTVGLLFSPERNGVMVALSMQTLSIVWAGAFLGALAAGGAGFAFALVASSIWLHGLEPLQTTALVVACGTLLHVTLVWPIRGSIEPARLFPFIIGAVIGIPLGVLALTQVNGSALKISLGVFLTIYGCYALLAPRLPNVTFGGRTADGAIGFIGGVLGGIGGYSGVIPTVWTQLRGWSKNTARGVYQPFILFAHVTTLLLVGAASFNRGGVTLFLCALPPLAAGAWLGFQIYGRLDERRFKQVLSAMLIASGLSLVI